MVFKGLIEDVFNNVTIFRGYASLKMLASISKANSYQRNIDSKHNEQIFEYFNKSSFLFFPELIFSLQFDDQNIITNIKKNEFPRGGIKTKEGIRISKGKFDYEKKLDNETSAKLISFDIPEDLVKKKILYRIDGNHRLSVVDEMIEMKNKNKIGEHNSIIDKIVPFSILLQTKSDVAQKYESAYFYLINAKAKTLTTEENLKTIFSNSSFTDIERQSLLGIADISVVSEIIDKINTGMNLSLKIFSDIFNNEVYTLAFDLLKLLPNASSEKIFEALVYIDNLYKNNKIQKSLPFVYLSLIAYRAKHNDEDTLKYLDWLVTTKLNQTDFCDVQQLLESYEKNFTKEYKVFVAMPYISFKRVNDFNKLFKEVLNEISRNQPYKLELIPIMRFRGESQRIDQRLIQKIKECDIFIADLSECNSNVIFEIGLAEGNDKPMILIKSKEDSEKTPFDDAKVNVKTQLPFDIDKLQWIPYSSTGYYNDIKSIMKNNIPEILVKKFGLVRKEK